MASQPSSGAWREAHHRPVLSVLVLLPAADSTVLAHVLSKLNRERGYGLQLLLLSIDEGIAGYRDDSLETVRRNERQVGATRLLGRVAGGGGETPGVPGPNLLPPQGLEGGQFGVSAC